MNREDAIGIEPATPTGSMNERRIPDPTARCRRGRGGADGLMNGAAPRR